MRELVDFEVSLERGRRADPEQHVIVVESGGHRAAVAVDELMGQAEYRREAVRRRAWRGGAIQRGHRPRGRSARP